MDIKNTVIALVLATRLSALEVLHNIWALMICLISMPGLYQANHSYPCYNYKITDGLFYYILAGIYTPILFFEVSMESFGPIMKIVHIISTNLCSVS